MKFTIRPLQALSSSSSSSRRPRLASSCNVSPTLPLLVATTLWIVVATTQAFLAPQPVLTARIPTLHRQPSVFPTRYYGGVSEYSEIDKMVDEKPIENSLNSSSRSSSASTRLVASSRAHDEEEADDTLLLLTFDENKNPVLETSPPARRPLETITKSAGASAESTLETRSSTSDFKNSNRTRQAEKRIVQYAALEPGTVVQIQIGDLSVARKAWKKRRRNASPLLVPCSILSTDRIAQIRWNTLYLLHKFGPSASSSSSSSNSKNLRLAVAELAHWHRSHLKSSLHKHAVAAGCASTQQFLEEVVWDAAAQRAYGVQLVERPAPAAPQEVDDDTTATTTSSRTTLYLEAPLSRTRAQKLASSAAILQFVSNDNDDSASSPILKHTGLVRSRRREDNKTVEEKVNKNYYQLQPLSAALRISQPDMSQIATGAQCAAVVLDYDLQADAGSPLLILTLNPALQQVRDRLQLNQRQPQQQHPRKWQPSSPLQPIQHEITQLSIGDSLSGKIVRLVKGGALVDCGVALDGTSVLGRLRFVDAVPNKGDNDNNNNNNNNNKAELVPLPNASDTEEDDDQEEDWDEILSLDEDESEEDDDVDDENHVGGTPLDPVETIISKIESVDDEFENSEDITHLFQQNDDGSLTYRDPETGGIQIIAEDDNEESDEDTPQTFFKRPTVQQFGYDDLEKALKKQRAPPPGPAYATTTLRVGDHINVFVKSVSGQSQQFSLTMDSAVQGKKAKVIKHESETKKKMTRLVKQLGGYRRLRELTGTECNGTIKAASNAGNWYYVQPGLDNLPVGVATVHRAMTEGLLQGDRVRIRLNGVDEDRGQLAIQILEKLPPN